MGASHGFVENADAAILSHLDTSVPKYEIASSVRPARGGDEQQMITAGPRTMAEKVEPTMLSRRLRPAHRVNRI